MAKERTIVSLFSGCGGMDLGLEGGFEVLCESVNVNIHPDWIAGQGQDGFVRLKETGLRHVFANDIKPSAQKAWSVHFAKRGVDSSIFRLRSIVDLVKEARESTTKSVFPLGADIVTGGFPCQDFSVAGKRMGFRSDKSHSGGVLDTQCEEPTIENRGMLYHWMKEAIEIIRPRLFIAENVKGLVNLANVKRVIEGDFRSISGSGYVVVEAKVLHAGDYGVPQTRERVFFVGFRRDALRSDARRALSLSTIPEDYDPYPPPTHNRQIGASEDTQTRLSPPITCRMAFRGLKEPNQETDDLSQIRFSRAKYMGKHCQGQSEVELDGLGPTIRAEHHGNIEFRRLSEEHGGRILEELQEGLSERRLTPRECARIQTFPDDYEFVIDRDGIRVSASDGYKLVGNAVPPLLAYHLGQRIQQMWEFYFR